MFTRVTQPAEIEQVVRLAREIWAEHYTPIIGSAQVDYMLERFQSQSAIQQQIHQGMHYILLQQSAGYFAYEVKPDHLFLSKIYVHSTFRRQALARKAIAWIIENENPSRIQLTVNRHNTHSITAYHHLGFQTIGEQVTDIGNGYIMDDHVMVLNRNFTFEDATRDHPRNDFGPRP